jgi:hypothetical protein
MPSSTLSTEQQPQWSFGKPSIVSDMLLQTFAFLQHKTTKQSKGKSIVNGNNVADDYSRVYQNILDCFNPRGKQRLSSPTLTERKHST